MLALLKPFKLVLIDEFLNELDVVIRDKFFKYLNKECQERRASIIYATHIFDNIEKWADSIIYMTNGHCSNKELINDFIKSDSLFESVKDKILEDKYKNSEDINYIDPLKFGPQYGYGDGRSNNL